MVLILRRLAQWHLRNDPLLFLFIYP